MLNRTFFELNASIVILAPPRPGYILKIFFYYFILYFNINNNNNLNVLIKIKNKK